MGTLVCVGELLAISLVHQVGLILVKAALTVTTWLVLASHTDFQDSTSGHLWMHKMRTLLISEVCPCIQRSNGSVPLFVGNDYFL